MVRHRVQLRHAIGWRLPVDAVSVDRRTRWANPFRVVQPILGSTQWMVRRGANIWLVDGERSAQSMAVDLYAGWLLEPGQSWLRDEIRRRFAGKRPACFCHEGVPCHGTVIAALAATPLECRAA